MAVETKRGCGYRKVGGLYLCGSGITTTCDRLPFPIEYCPTCGAGIKFTQGFTWIDWKEFAGEHEGCNDKHLMCYLCVPDVHPQPYGLLWVGEAYYSPQSFIKEVMEVGVSKRIPFIPKELKLGETVVLLAHKKAIDVTLEPVHENIIPGTSEEDIKFNTEVMEEDIKKKPEYIPAIFYAFKSMAIEMPIWKSELTDEKKEELMKRGITPISIPDGDVDHSDKEVVIAYDPLSKKFSKVLLEE